MDTQTEAFDKCDAQMQAPDDLFIQGTIAMPVSEGDDAKTATSMAL